MQYQLLFSDAAQNLRYLPGKTTALDFWWIAVVSGKRTEERDWAPFR